MNNSFDLFRNYALGNDEYKKFTDKELMCLIKADDVKAEKYLYVRYVFVVKKVVSTFFLIGGDKDDLFQEAMIGLIKAVDSFNFDENIYFRSFAELCIRRQIISAIRKSKGYGENLLNNCVSLYQFDNDEIETNIIEQLIDISCPDPENAILVKEQMNTYKEIQSKLLSKFERDVLYEFEKGKSYEEISIILDKDVKSIDNALHRIRSKINNSRDEIFGNC